MTAELYQYINTFINIIITAVLLFVIVSKKKHTKKILLLTVLLLLVQLATLFVSFYLTPILTLSLLILLIMVLAHPPQVRFNDNSDLIAQAKEQERSRIYANLHDDVGAKLLELIYSAESDKSRKLAKEVLSDIRQAVASTINIQCNTEQLAQEISQEMRARLQPLSIEFTERLDTSTKQKLAATIPSVLSRIMREATSNIIKHAQATEVSLLVVSTDKYLSLSVEDNGIGFNMDKKSGKGLKTMQKRAQSIGAEVNWQHRQTSGTKFTLIYHYGNE